MKRKRLLIILCLLSFGCARQAPAARTKMARMPARAPVQTAAPETTEPETTAPETTEIDREDWRLILVNAWNPLPEGFEVELTVLENGLCVDGRIREDLQQMMSGARAEGLQMVICSAYRTQQEQQWLYEARVERARAEGFSDAPAEAGRWVAKPNASEHQTGLALDITAAEYRCLTEEQGETPEQRWLMDNAWRYGFILRYPRDKCHITGIGYEPWHYRYVGREAARAIQDKGLCLEEYLGQGNIIE